jgi:hypothetical protein
MNRWHTTTLTLTNQRRGSDLKPGSPAQRLKSAVTGNCAVASTRIGVLGTPAHPRYGSGHPGARRHHHPSAWPGDRFDVIWTFTLDPATGRYVFGQVPQQLLLGDTNTVISDHDTGKVT